MPGGDRTGPSGLGPMSGRGAGYCSGFGAPGYANAMRGGRFGRGSGFSGRGRGWRNRFWQTGLPGWMRSDVGDAQPFMPAPQMQVTDDTKQEVELLRRQARSLEQSLKNVQSRLDSLDSDNEEKTS